MHSFPQFTHKFLWVGGAEGRQLFSGKVFLGDNYPWRQLSRGQLWYLNLLLKQIQKKLPAFCQLCLARKSLTCYSHVNILSGKKTFCSKKRGPRGRGWSFPLPPPFSFPTALSYINFF